MPATAFTEARTNLSTLFGRAATGPAPVLIERRGEACALVGLPVLRRLVEDRQFTVDAARDDDGAVSLWLYELELYGTGSSIAEAVTDLEEQVRAYADDYVQRRYDLSPNRAAQLPWVVRAILEDQAGTLAGALVGGDV